MTCWSVPGSPRTMTWDADLHPRTLVAFVVDVSERMSIKENERTYLEQCQHFVSLRILEIMLRGLSTIKVCVCTYGDHHDEKDGFAGLRILCRTAKPTTDMLRAVHDLRPATSTAAYEPTLALSSTLDMMATKDHGEPSWAKVVYFATRPGLPENRADVEVFRTQLIDTHIHLRVLAYGPSSDVYSLKNAFWQRLIQDVPGSTIVSPEEAMSQAEAPTLQIPSSHPINTTLSFGDIHASDKTSLHFPVQIIKATAQQRMHAPRRILKDATEDRDIDTKRVMYRADEVLRAGNDLSQIAPLPDECQAHVQRAYKLGASIVPQEETPPAISTTAGLEILHFVNASTYRREYHVGETYMVLAHPKSRRAQLSLSSLVHAASIRGVYALCRFVARTHSDPKLCLLAPMIENEYDAFYMVHVPFRDDVKRSAFPPLDRVTTSTGQSLYEHPTIPTKEQQSRMDTFVDLMDLMDMDDHPDGWYAPSLCYHPAIHALKHAIKWRFMFPDQPLPPLHPKLQEFLHIPSSVEARARDTRTACAAAFQVHAPQKHPATEAASEIPAKQVKEDNSETETETETEPDTTTNTNAELIPLDQILPTFEARIKTSAVSETCQDMSRTLLTLVSRQVEANHIMEAMHVFRHSAAELDESLTYNTYVPCPNLQLCTHTSLTCAYTTSCLVESFEAPYGPWSYHA